MTSFLYQLIVLYIAGYQVLVGSKEIGTKETDVTAELVLEVQHLRQRVTQLEQNAASQAVVIGTLTDRLETRNANNLIGFTVTLSGDQDVPPSGTIIWDVVTTNEGGGYDEDTGKFTCPVNGLYFIMFNILTTADDDWVTQIQMDDGNGLRGLTGIRNLGAHTLNSGTGNVIYCLQGGTIWLVNTDTGDRMARSHEDGVPQSVFTGFLIEFMA